MRREEGPAWRLARITWTIALLGFGGQLAVQFVLPQWTDIEGLRARTSIVIGALDAGACFSSALLFWTWLTCCIDRSKAPWLWATLVFATSGVALYAALVATREFCGSVLWLSDPESWGTSDGSWEYDLRELNNWVNDRRISLGNPARAVALAGILLFLVKLPRRSSAK